WLATEIGGPFNGSWLAQVCNETTWRSDVALHMTHSRGGLANVRGTILDFLHFAIRTGTAHLVLPSYVKRTDTSLDWMDESNGYWPFSNLFDDVWFLDTMKTHCPQVTFYGNVTDVPATAFVEPDYEIHTARPDKRPDESIAATAAHFAAWLADNPAGYQPGLLNLVNVGATLWAFDMMTSPRMRLVLGRMCKINPRIRELAATATWNLRGLHNLSETLDPRDQIYQDAFYGMHLRTEADASTVNWDSQFGGFDSQTDIHLEKCQGLGLQVIYVASGNQEDIERFKEKAMDRANITVVSKKDLITDPDDQAVLDGMTWDQHGALDWEVLARSTYFSGPVMSSFSWNLAYRRN
ncbi:hypothetical protein M406DRAFT_239600, partial [Cryphonectria parasitica EP155]